MKAIDIYNEKQRETARAYMIASKDQEATELERAEAHLSYLYLRLECLERQLEAYKQHDFNEIVEDEENEEFGFVETVKDVMREIACDIINTKHYIVEANAIVDYLIDHLRR